MIWVCSPFFFFLFIKYRSYSLKSGDCLQRVPGQYWSNSVLVSKSPQKHKSSWRIMHELVDPPYVVFTYSLRHCAINNRNWNAKEHSSGTIKVIIQRLIHKYGWRGTIMIAELGLLQVTNFPSVNHYWK